MPWPEKVKLTKQVIRSATEAGYAGPTEVQIKTLSRINGGQDVIVIGPEGCGKTTTYILAVINRIKYDVEGVPRVLILVPDKEHVLEAINLFNLLNRNTAVSICGLYAAPGIEAQMNELADGADIVVATPDRARAIYLKLGLNLNKIDLFIIDDADMIIKQGLQLPVAELANSIGKSQHLVFTEVMHDKLRKLIDPFMKLPAIVEVEETGMNQLATIPQVLYHVPNFGTKLNLLNLFMQDNDLFNKTMVFVNTRQTAETVFKSLQNRLKDGVIILKPGNDVFTEIQCFKASEKQRVMVVNNETVEALALKEIPFLLHFEIPDDKLVFIQRIIAGDPETDLERLSITFITDLELGAIKKIEQSIGHKIPASDLPAELVIQQEHAIEIEKPILKKNLSAPVAGEAFHEKKASNAKTYNFSSGQKAKMNNKRKH